VKTWRCVDAGKLWTAPEILRENNPPLCGTQRGDVYSYAVVCYEIMMRSEPYNLEETIPRGKVDSQTVEQRTVKARTQRTNWTELNWTESCKIMNMQIHVSEYQLAAQLSGTKLEISTVVSFVNKTKNYIRPIYYIITSHIN